MNIYTQGPTDNLDRTLDFSDFVPVGDSIQTAAWSASPSGGTLSLQSHTANTATTWFLGPLLGAYYRLSCAIVTVNGLTLTRSLVVEIKDA